MGCGKELLRHVAARGLRQIAIDAQHVVERAHDIAGQKIGGAHAGGANALPKRLRIGDALSTRCTSSSRARFCLRPAALATRGRHSGVRVGAVGEPSRQLSFPAERAEQQTFEIVRCQLLDPRNIERDVVEQAGDSGGLLVFGNRRSLAEARWPADRRE